MRLDGKTALITGGGSGIGLAIARSLAAEGARVAIAGRGEARLRSAAEGPLPLAFHPVDVADRDSVQTLIDWSLAELGHLDIFVNSSGVNIPNRSMAAMRPDEWDRILAINATGAYNCLYAVLPHLRTRGQGLVVNISSIAGKRSTPLGGVAYNASKFAMSALGIAVAQEEAPHGIRVTNVYPGEVDTPILEHRPQPVTAEHRATILQPEDVADLVLAIACLPPRAHVPEVVIKPIGQPWA